MIRDGQHSIESIQIIDQRSVSGCKKSLGILLASVYSR